MNRISRIKIAVVTTSRADYSIYRSTLQALAKQHTVDLQLIVGGSHLSPAHGLTIRLIEHDGLPIAERVEQLVLGDTSATINKSLALGILGFSDAFCRLEPDCLVVLGDRYEMFAAVLAALPLNIPVAHIHGGELTFGAMDDSIRHSITKLSHLHFVSCTEAAARVHQLGEAKERIHLVGAPALDSLAVMTLPNRDEWISSVGLSPDCSPVLATFHPVTRDLTPPGEQVEPMLSALGRCTLPIVFTAPNADPGGMAVRAKIESFVQTHPHAVLVENLGPARYFAAQRDATLMIGNSSSGILEAASFGLPVVDIGTRQAGRQRAANVVHADNNVEAIASALAQVQTASFRSAVKMVRNPYDHGGASEKISAILTSLPSREKLIDKKFSDIYGIGST